MGRRLRCTPDHPFVTREGIKLAADLTTDDWLPIALGAPAGSPTEVFDVLQGLDAAALDRSRVFIAPGPASPDGERFGRGLRLDAAEATGLAIEHAVVRSASNGNPIPTRLMTDVDFWRVVGLYIAEGHAAPTGTWPRIFWSFHPSRDVDLVADVVGFWKSRRVHCGDSERADRDACRHLVASSRRVVARRSRARPELLRAAPSGRDLVRARE